MYFAPTALAILAVGGANAFNFPESVESTFNKLVSRKGGSDGCPKVWNSISSEFVTMFTDTSVRPAQCNDDARAAIRLAFHDCGAYKKSQGKVGGCDGSIILSTGNNELQRGENNGLQDISAKVWALQKKYVKQDSSVTVADMIQMAGAVAIVACPGGPQMKLFMGRKDSSTPAPDGLLPDVHASAASLNQLFLDKGFSSAELAALLGAHSTSKAFNQPDIKAGAPQDSTPGIWDVKYYAETYNPPAGVVPFASDKVLANYADVGAEFKKFVGNAGRWNGKFADAMTHMSQLGAGQAANIDCTQYVPKGKSNKRGMMGASMFHKH
ncbi:hypothetical protein HYFRA_00000655 [Hymenoscyphus fraxineus]|uniref:Peroxidase n=1 Tax=Hymenoscyphus fraxineus TaxID=746836 RepID=A0A9N9L170_9HELO|nr:hypothetical protein HYFRA_00000655 [Hymenoscyphus fraxineus]